MISNHPSGYLESASIPIQPSTPYDLHAWLRGRLDKRRSSSHDDGFGQWALRARFFDSTGAFISQVDVDSGGPGSLSDTWSQKGGRLTTPENAASLRIWMLDDQAAGWIAIDDVSLVAAATVTKYYYALRRDAF